MARAAHLGRFLIVLYCFEGCLICYYVLLLVTKGANAEINLSTPLFLNMK